jgi:hypothetical protein
MSRYIDCMIIVNFAIDEGKLEFPLGGTGGGQRAGGRWPPRRPRRRSWRATPASAVQMWRLWLLLSSFLVLLVGLGVSSVVEIRENPKLYLALLSAPPMSGL